MRIGIDAKWYFEGPPSGRIVVKNLIDHLLSGDLRGNKIFLFIDKQNTQEASRIWHQENVEVISLPKVLNMVSNAFLVHFYASKHKLDIVLFQNFSSFLPSRWKKVVYIHDLLFMDFPEYYSKMERWYFKPMLWLAAKSDSIITISHSEKNRLLKYNVARESDISVVYHGIDRKFSPIESYSKEQISDVKIKYNLPDRYLLYVGRINIRKNLLNLVKGFALAPDTGQYLVIVGKVDHKNVDVNATIDELNLRDRIIFLGHVPDNDLFAIYALAFAFCFPSYAEGFGLPPLEAMRSGIPSIVSDRTSLPEVCGAAGIYINPDDPADIAEKIEKLSKDQIYYSEMRHRALTHSAGFTWEKAADNILDIITK